MEVKYSRAQNIYFCRYARPPFRMEKIPTLFDAFETVERICRLGIIFYVPKMERQTSGATYFCEYRAHNGLQPGLS